MVPAPRTNADAPIRRYFFIRPPTGSLAAAPRLRSSAPQQLASARLRLFEPSTGIDRHASLSDFQIELGPRLSTIGHRTDRRTCRDGLSDTDVRPVQARQYEMVSTGQPQYQDDAPAFDRPDVFHHALAGGPHCGARIGGDGDPV